MPDLIAGLNSYVTLDEADAYLAGSLQAATLWAALSDADKTLALISATRSLERERWAGDKSGVESSLALAVTAAGTGYAIGDLVQIDGVGAVGTKAVIEVLTVGGSGEILTARFIHVGFYSTAPAFPASTTALTGSGVNATITLTLTDQFMEWPRDLSSCSALADLSTTAVPSDIKAAECELAFQFSQDPTLENNVGAGASGTDGNIKKVEAGSAKVTYFRPTDGVPFPTVTWQLMKDYRDGACPSSTTTVGSVAYGTGDSSAFTCPDDRYGVNRGYA